MLVDACNPMVQPMHGVQADDTSNHRGHALNELIDTEKKYLGVLDVMIDVYDAGFAKSSKLVSESDRKSMFSNVAVRQP